MPGPGRTRPFRHREARSPGYGLGTSASVADHEPERSPQTSSRPRASSNRPGRRWVRVRLGSRPTGPDVWPCGNKHVGIVEPDRVTVYPAGLGDSTNERFGRVTHDATLTAR